MSIGRNHFVFFITHTHNYWRHLPINTSINSGPHRQRPHNMNKKSSWPKRIPVSRYLWPFVVLFWLSPVTTQRLASTAGGRRRSHCQACFWETFHQIWEAAGCRGGGRICSHPANRSISVAVAVAVLGPGSHSSFQLIPKVLDGCV